MSTTLLLTLVLMSSCSGLDLGSLLSLPQLRSATPEAPVLPEIVEVVRWRQPVCVLPKTNQVLPCFLFMNKHQSQYEQTSDNGQVNTFHPKKSLNAKEVRTSISIDEIEHSSILQPTEEIRERVAAQSTPGLEDAVNVRRSGRSIFNDGRANQLDASKPPPIVVTKVLNSPTTATLVAQNCWPDIGLPMCEDVAEKFPSVSSEKLSTDDSPLRQSLLDQAKPSFNITGDAEEELHDQPMENSFTSTTEPSSPEAIRELLHKLLDEYAANATAAIDKNPVEFMNSMLKDDKKDKKESPLDQTQPPFDEPKTPFDEPKIPFDEPKSPFGEPEARLAVMKMVHDLFFHRPGIKEYVANITADAEEQFHDQPTDPNQEPPILKLIHDHLLHQPKFYEFVDNISTAIEKKIHDDVDVEMMSPLVLLEALMEANFKANNKEMLARTATVQDVVDKKHEVLQSIVEKKEAAVQGLVDKSHKVLETISEAAAGKKTLVQGILDKKHEAVRGVIEKKQDAVQAIIDKKNQLVEGVIEKKNQLVEGVIEKKNQLVDSLSQKKDSVVQAIVDKQAVIKGMVEKTQNAVQGLIDKKVAMEMDLASRGQNLVQNIAEKKVNLIQNIAEKKQSMIQQLADKKTDAIKAISEKTQEIIGTVSVMKPLLISSIQQNLGITPKETLPEDSDLETTTATITTTAEDDEIVFQEEPTDVEEVPLVDERSAADGSIAAENEAATTTEKLYQVFASGPEGVSGRSTGLLDHKKKFIRFKLNHLTKFYKIPGKPGLHAVFPAENIIKTNITTKPNIFLTYLFNLLLNHHKPENDDNTASSSSSSTQAAAIVTESADPVTSEQEAPEVTSALPDKIAGTEHDSVEEDESVSELPLNSSSARPPFQSLSLPGFTEENEEEPDADQLQVVDESFAPISKDPPAEVSFAPTSTTETDDEPIVIDYKPTTTASPETKTIVPNADSNERPAVLTGIVKPNGNGDDDFVIVGDLQYVDNKANCTHGVADDAERETLQEI